MTMLVFGPADADGVRSAVSGAVVTSDANTAEFGPKYLNAVADFGLLRDLRRRERGDDGKRTVSFFNVSPGRADFTVEVAGHICGPGIAGPLLNASIASHIEAGRATYMTVACEVAED